MDNNTESLREENNNPILLSGMFISIIVPTYREEATIVQTVEYLLSVTQNASSEIIIVDAGSGDNTIAFAVKAGASIAVTAPEKGRAAQMNYGASLAKGDVYYFVHADSIPPETFIQDITQAIQNGFQIGRYRTKFDSNSWLLKLNAFFTRFDWLMCYGGDQTLFIKASLFKFLNGFKSEMKIMEEYDLVMRARIMSKYKIFKGKTLISARKYKLNSWFNTMQQ